MGFSLGNFFDYFTVRKSFANNNTTFSSRLNVVYMTFFRSLFHNFVCDLVIAN